MKPLAIDLFCGLGGWTEGLLDAGWDVVGFDIEQHAYGDDRYPGKLVIQDVLTIHGSQFRGVDLIVASPPCQFFSYAAMPWTRAKQLAAEVRADPVKLAERLALFKACFRIQREASEAAGRHIPMVVENVRGAIPWVGRSKYAFGSYHLWGDVPALMPAPVKAHKVPGFRFDGSGRSFQTASVKAHEGLKHGGDWFSDPSSPSRQGGQVKAVADGRRGAEWFDGNLCVKSSNSPARKAASAKIAQIPYALSRWIGEVYLPAAIQSEAA